MEMNPQMTPEDLEQLIHSAFRDAATKVGKMSAEATTLAGNAQKMMAAAEKKMVEADERLRHVETDEKILVKKKSQYLADVNALGARKNTLARAEADLLERETAIARLLIAKEIDSKAAV